MKRFLYPSLVLLLLIKLVTKLSHGMGIPAQAGETAAYQAGFATGYLASLVLIALAAAGLVWESWRLWSDAAGTASTDG
ncbi:MAG: hypothetical protein U5K31_12940 [Balneolaceae bacterium]|nr:hypothetical protein [Balneolaceae bacterium]